MLLCLSFCLSVGKLFFRQRFHSNYKCTGVRILKFVTQFDSDELYCLTKEQPHIVYQSFYLFIFISVADFSVSIGDSVFKLCVHP